MKPVVFVCMVVALSGCLSSGDGGVRGSEDPGPRGSGDQADAGDASGKTGGGRVEGDTNVTAPPLMMTDCDHLYGFVPVPFDAAAALLPSFAEPVSWIMEGDGTLATLMALSVDCQHAVLNGTDLGPARSLWLAPDIVAPDKDTLEQNNFLVYSAHSDQELVEFWNRYGPSTAAEFTTTSEVQGHATATVVRGADITVEMALADPQAAGGLVKATSRWFHDGAEAGALDTTVVNAQGTLGGTLTASIPVSPIDLGTPATGGFGNGHGRLDELTFQPIKS